MHNVRVGPSQKFAFIFRVYNNCKAGYFTTKLSFKFRFLLPWEIRGADHTELAPMLGESQLALRSCWFFRHGMFPTTQSPQLHASQSNTCLPLTPFLHYLPGS